MTATDRKPVSYYTAALAYVNSLSGGAFDFASEQLEYWTQGGHQPLSGPHGLTSREAGDIMLEIRHLARLGM